MANENSPNRRMRFHELKKHFEDFSKGSPTHGREDGPPQRRDISDYLRADQGLYDSPRHERDNDELDDDPDRLELDELDPDRSYMEDDPELYDDPDRLEHDELDHDRAYMEDDDELYDDSERQEYVEYHPDRSLVSGRGSTNQEESNRSFSHSFRPGSGSSQKQYARTSPPLPAPRPGVFFDENWPDWKKTVWHLMEDPQFKQPPPPVSRYAVPDTESEYETEDEDTGDDDVLKPERDVEKNGHDPKSSQEYQRGTGSSPGPYGPHYVVPESKPEDEEDDNEFTPERVSQNILAPRPGEFFNENWDEGTKRIWHILHDPQFKQPPPPVSRYAVSDTESEYETEDEETGDDNAFTPERDVGKNEHDRGFGQEYQRGLGSRPGPYIKFSNRPPPGRNRGSPSKPATQNYEDPTSYQAVNKKKHSYFPEMVPAQRKWEHPLDYDMYKNVMMCKTMEEARKMHKKYLEQDEFKQHPIQQEKPMVGGALLNKGIRMMVNIGAPVFRRDIEG